ncbi:DUF4442 domain-containing protein [Wenzhouxiangella limi]|uniref:DUF4442 domain-containing protein n=1 Tax=Wenzhouxiangella limi TaxID=2707351 RepID=A0A845URL5_9GAMM|nr:DUF4442 domain-containing protein [Wenzhouxiangella limi]NDY94483.1 DUF4442 domain-containing protein [Wenzhouxiangella limi]
MNVWPPYLAAGIRVRRISDDFRHARVELRLGLLNRNYVHVHFGGSLFAMTDPFYMLMYIKNLGPDYLVWDKSAAIDFVRPGRGTVAAEFRLEESDFEHARTEALRQRAFLVKHPVEIRDREDAVVARVERTIYIRRKLERAA